MVLVVEFLIVIGCLAAALWGLRWAITRIRILIQKRKPWQMHTDTVNTPIGNVVVISVSRPHHMPVEIERISATADDFDMQLFKAQAEARNVARALNAGERPLGSLGG